MARISSSIVALSLSPFWRYLWQTAVLSALQLQGTFLPAEVMDTRLKGVAAEAEPLPEALEKSLPMRPPGLKLACIELLPTLLSYGSLSPAMLSPPRPLPICVSWLEGGR